MTLNNRRTRIIHFIASYLFFSLFIIALFYPSMALGKRSALVLYDEVTQDYGTSLVNILGHFYNEYDVNLINISKADLEEVKEVDALFLLATYFSFNYDINLIKVIGEREIQGNKITCLIGTPPWLKRSKTMKSFTYVSYKGNDYREGTYDLFPVDIDFDITLAKLHMGDKTDETPLIARRGNLWIIQGFPIFGIHSWILGDALHDILEVKHKDDKNVSLRLEDVNPSYSDRDIKNLEECIEYLHSENIPFFVVVYPVFIDRKSNKIITLAQNPKLISVLKKAEKMGGNIVMHGVTHQHQYMEVSGEGSEFWDMIEDKPLYNEVEFFNERISYGLKIFKEAGLNPLFFEAPHYNLSLNLQFELSKYFSTLLGSVLISDRTYRISQSFPFLIYKSYSGLMVIPEQLGYISVDDISGSISSIKEKALKLKNIVRDPMACFFYHPFVNGVVPLKELISFFINEGFSFVNISSYVQPPKALTIDTSSSKPIEDITKIGRKPIYIGKTFATFSIASSILFFLIYLKILKKRKRRLFEIDKPS